MCNGLSFSAWEAETIQQMIDIQGVSIELLIGNSEIMEPIIPDYESNYPSINIFKKVIRRLNRIFQIILKFIKTPFWQRYQNIVNSYFTADCDKQVSMISKLIDVDMIYCRVENKGKYSQYFNQEDIQKIKSYDLDIILRFGFNIIRGEILSIPKYGVWSYHHGDYLKYRGGPPGFWEIYNEDPWSGAILQKLKDKLDDGIVLYNSQIKTDLSSYQNNKNKLFWSTVSWPSIVCRNILQENDESIFNKSKSSTAPIYTAPTNIQTIKYFYITIKYKLLSLLKRNTNNNRELWAIGIINKPINKLINSLKPQTINWIEPPKGRFYADPFLISEGNTSYIFFEDYSYSKERGRISFIQTNDFNTYSEPKPILDTKFHLSYPSILVDKGKYYCIPEQHESGEVALYEAESFPEKWVKKKTLLKNFNGVDPTLIQYDDKWWMFVANQKDNDSSKLYLFYSNKIDGDWKPHKNNPVKIYPNMTRPAGSIFNYNGKIIRPAQNCTQTYGGSALFYEITNLSIDEYKEEFIGELLPNLQSPYPDGLHHIALHTDITVVDGKRWI